MLAAIKKHNLEQTAEQMMAAAQNSVYVWWNYNLTPVHRLAWHLKRSDITVVSPTQDLRKFRGRPHIRDHKFSQVR